MTASSPGGESRPPSPNELPVELREWSTSRLGLASVVELLDEWPKLARTVEAPACAGTDTETWFSLEADQIAICLRICAGCPVREACLAGALARDEQWGIWGGRVFTPRLKTIHVRDVGGHWVVSGVTVAGVATASGWFPKRSDAEAYRDELAAAHGERAGLAREAPATLKGRHGLVGTDAA